MLDTFSLLTIELARAYGAGIVIAALAALLMPARMITVLADLERNPAIIFLAALFAIVLGLVMIVLHSVWTDFPAILVSLLGWAVIAKGIVLLAAPEGIMKLAAVFTPAHIRLWGVVVLILGAVYLAIGLTGHASVG